MTEAKLFSTRLPKEVIKFLKIRSAVSDTSVQQLVTKILTEWIEEQEKVGK